MSNRFIEMGDDLVVDSRFIETGEDLVVEQAVDDAWNEEDHPRHPEGSSEGGQFAVAGGSDNSEVISSDAKPSRSEWNSLIKYTGTHYQSINDTLNNGFQLSDEFAEISGDLDAVLNRSRILKDATVFRGLRADSVLASKFAQSDFKIGQELAMPAFTSTTKDLKLLNTETFNSSFGFEIKLPKGVNALDYDTIKNYPRGEGEVLLPRNTKVQVTGWSERDGKKLLRVRVIK